LVLLSHAKGAFFLNQEALGLALGPAKGEGNKMAQWMLKANGEVAPRRSSQPLKVDEIHYAVELKKRTMFNGWIEKRWGTSINPPKWNDAENLDDNEFKEHEDKDEPKKDCTQHRGHGQR
jgi:hypothetical protein